MKVSHVIYKVNDLDKSVEEYRKKGFVVEYGKAKNPINALIYFSEGPYFELLESTGMPTLLKKMMKLFGKNKFFERMDFWDTHPGGLCGMHLENYSTNLDKEKELLKKYEQKYFEVKAGRKDTKGRDLKYTCIFPDEMGIPSLMTYFNIDPKPKNFIHPNGVERIAKVSFGTPKMFFPLIHELCDDEMLELFESDIPGDMNIEYKYSN